jgi:catechol 2,3-dioxygenase-like lactoylglutathione lyase family enzyme
VENLSANPFEAIDLSPSFTVDDLSRSVAWYRDVLGFVVERSYDQGAVRATVVTAGAVRFLLTQDDRAKGEREKGLGFSFMLTTTQDVDAIARRVSEHGWPIDSGPADIWGRRAFRLRDPDGFKLVISSPQSPAGTAA